MKKAFITLVLSGLFCVSNAQSTIIQYLSGVDKDHTVQWDFFCTSGRKSNVWSKIEVPSNWEFQGFGNFNYGHDKIKHNEQGIYKCHFIVPKKNIGHKVFIVFEGSMTDTEVKINGKLAGPVHQGSFYRFKYDITSLVNFGKDNLLEAIVSKESANKSVNTAERKSDFWIFGGIFRPVYLEITPPVFIDRVAINARADGSFAADIYIPDENIQKNNTGFVLEAQVRNLSGKAVGRPVVVVPHENKTTLATNFKAPVLWNPESPNLYQAVFVLKQNGKIIHQYVQRFGFRTVELRLHDGIYVNNKKIIFKGVNRHSEWPETGRTTSKKLSVLDVNLMKDMNMNAVRMSHYPPDQHFLDVCDSLGLFVLDELTGWQGAYDTIAGRKLVKEMIVRDVNHPSILFWDNGNEGGWNRGLDDDFQLYDPQKRVVLHPWEKFNGTDTKHYPDYNFMVAASDKIKEVFFPTEFMHGLYDGGHGAALDDFWNLMMKNPLNAGGFLWCFADGGIVRADKEGNIDTDGNHAPDGILGPHREKEASFYTIKEIWSPVYIEKPVLNDDFKGKLFVENRYLYTDLKQCVFKWKLSSFPPPQSVKIDAATNMSRIVKTASIPPGQKGEINLDLPATWADNDVLYLTATDPSGREIFTWSWAIKSASNTANKFIISASTLAIKTSENDSTLIIVQEGIQYLFSKANGCLLKVVTPRNSLSLTNGPVLAGSKMMLTELKHYEEGSGYIVEPIYRGDDQFAVKWKFTPGQLVQLSYEYLQKGEADFRGVTFTYPEEKVTGLKYLGRGPYRVWQNRLKGMQLGVWQKTYNNTITGESWLYPEFKGYYSEIYWAQVKNMESDFIVYSGNEDKYLLMLKPVNPLGAGNTNTSPAFPEGNLGFMDVISPIGTKFQTVEKMGPQSQKNKMIDGKPIRGTLWFDFR